MENQMEKKLENQMESRIMPAVCKDLAVFEQEFNICPQSNFWAAFLKRPDCIFIQLLSQLLSHHGISQHWQQFQRAAFLSQVLG